MTATHEALHEGFTIAGGTKMKKMATIAMIALVMDIATCGFAQVQSAEDPFVKIGSGRENVAAPPVQASPEEAKSMPVQVEVEVQFVAFPREEIERIAAEGMVCIEHLKELRIQGKSALLAAPRAVTWPGNVATVKGVEECIYATEFEVHTSLGKTNTQSLVAADSSLGNATGVLAPSVAGVVLAPGAFETRELGAAFEVLPEIEAETPHLIQLQISSHFVVEATWRDSGGVYVDASGTKRELGADMPTFHAYEATTSVTVENGKTVLLGGGMDTTDEKALVYMFLTTRLIGTDGKATTTRK